MHRNPIYEPEMTIQEIADILDIPESHVRYALASALKKLRLKYLARGYKKTDFLDDTALNL